MRAGTAPRAGIGCGGQTRSTRAGPGEARPPRPPGNILAFRGAPSFILVSRVFLATTFVTSKFSPSPSRLPLPPSLGEATPKGGGTGRRGPTPRVTWSGSRGDPRGAGWQGEGARQPMGQGGGAGAIARGCARAAAARRGGAGRGWAGPGLAWPGLFWSVVRWTLPGSADRDVGTRPALLPRAPEVAGEQAGSRPGRSSGCQVPTDLGFGSRRGCGINTNVESAFLRPSHEQGSGRISVLLAARLLPWEYHFLYLSLNIQH